jgi:ubiquinone/menaquinone biosynthesis C-methylase UbiE
MKNKNGSHSVEYLHGYTSHEQMRLYAQARVLEESVFRGVDFSKCKKVLEVGCGVGAQTEILLERFPHLELVSVDRSEEQVEQAKNHFRKHINQKRVDFRVVDAAQMSFEEKSFDGAFLCWVLEHVTDSVRILTEVKRCLKPGGKIFLNEVFNQLMFIHPESQAVQTYWRHYNELQREMLGDPYLGAKIGNYLSEAGFLKIETQMEKEFWDRRNPERRKFVANYWSELLMSAAPTLLKSGKTDEYTVNQVKGDLSRVGSDPNGIIFFAWMKGMGER